MKQNKTEKTLSWKQLLKLYKKIRIPWLMLILVGGSSILIKQAQLWLVPYTSKIMTGAITEHGFLAGFVGFTLINAVIEAIQGGVNELAGQMTQRNVRHTVWNRILHLPMSYFGNEDRQGLVSRVTQDTTGTYAAIAAMIQLISVIYGTVAAFQKMYITYKSLTLLMLTSIPITLFSAWLIGKMQYKISYINNTAISKMTNFFAERLPGIMRIKTAGTEDDEYRNGVKANDDRYRAEIRQERIFIFTGPVGSMAQYINEIVLLLAASALVRTDSMKMYQLVNLYNYYLLFMSNAFMFSAVWQSVKTSHGSSTTIAKLVDAEEEDLETGTAIDSLSGSIEGRGISFSYDEQRQVLSDVSFSIPAGKITAVVGENGCGKSTLISLLERFQHEQSGELTIDGVSLDELRLKDWRESVGYLFQGNQIIQGTIRENITYGIHRDFTEDELVDAAKKARAYDFIQKKEQGFDTPISRFDNKCSGGEMQRIAIARMILKRPEILIMDEATSGIDVVSEHEVMEGLMELMAGKTVIMVSHDMEMIRKADHLIVLNGGKVEASGSFRQVTQVSPLFQSFLEKGGCKA